MRIGRGAQHYVYDLPRDSVILSHWKAGRNTNQIAHELWCPEHVVVNRLPFILMRERQDAEFDQSYSLRAS